MEPTLKVLSPEKFIVGECRRVCPPGRPQSGSRYGVRCGYSPGSEAVSSLTSRACGNQGDPRIGPLEAGTREQVKSEDVGGVAWKSEPSIRALTPGNAGRAKGWRPEITRG